MWHSCHETSNLSEIPVTQQLHCVISTHSNYTVWHPHYTATWHPRHIATTLCDIPVTQQLHCVTSSSHSNNTVWHPCHIATTMCVIPVTQQLLCVTSLSHSNYTVWYSKQFKQYILFLMLLCLYIITESTIIFCLFHYHFTGLLYQHAYFINIGCILADSLSMHMHHKNSWKAKNLGRNVHLNSHVMPLLHFCRKF